MSQFLIAQKLAFVFSFADISSVFLASLSLTGFTERFYGGFYFAL